MIEKSFNIFLRGSLTPMILSELKEGPKHGYGIINCFRKKTGVYYGPSTIYPLLIELEGRKLVKSNWDFSCKTGRPQKVYTLTKEGEEFLYQISIQITTVLTETQLLTRRV